MTTMDEFDQVERDLEDVYAAPVPGLRFEPPLARRRWRDTARMGGRPWRLGLGVAAVSATLVAGVLTLPAWGGRTSVVNAQDLLDRTGHASVALAAIAPAYHLSTVVTAARSSGHSETWYRGVGEARTESTSVEDGVTVIFGTAASNGEFWLYRTRGTETMVAHIAHSDRTDVVAATPSLADVLGNYAIPGCQSATVDSETTVAGHAAYVVQVRPTPATCVADPSNPDTVKVAQVVGELGSATITIDKATDVTLALEQRDQDGAVQYSYRVEAFETGVAAASAGLPYVAPAGARVVEVADYSAAKSLLFTTP